MEPSWRRSRKPSSAAAGSARTRQRQDLAQTRRKSVWTQVQAAVSDIDDNDAVIMYWRPDPAQIRRVQAAIVSKYS